MNAPLLGNSESEAVCVCGHPMRSHELVKGFELSPGVTITNEDGTPTYTGDVLVCSGGRVVEITEDTSPWDCVCGCVLHP